MNIGMPPDYVCLNFLFNLSGRIPGLELGQYLLLALLINLLLWSGPFRNRKFLKIMLPVAAAQLLLLLLPIAIGAVFGPGIGAYNLSLFGLSVGNIILFATLALLPSLLEDEPVPKPALWLMIGNTMGGIFAQLAVICYFFVYFNR